MNKKIYIVTRGEYSDYHIFGVFETKEKAEELCHILKREKEYDYGTIEEWNINTDVRSQFKKYKYLSCDYTRGMFATIPSFDEVNFYEMKDSAIIGIINVKSHLEIDYNRFNNNMYEVRGTVYGETEEECRKIAQDIFNKEKARILGL